MDLLTHLEKVKKKQFLEQANYVYIGTLVSSTVILPLLYFAGSPFSFFATIFSALLSLLCFFLNRGRLYSLASALFIGNITFQTVANTLIFGTKSGFVFYFFNMAVLIIFTNWKGIYKLLAIVAQTSIFIALSIYSIYIPPISPMSESLTITFFIINIILNIVGVANSANFYLIIATHAQRDLRLYAITDYLTQLPNRTAFHHFIQGLSKRKDRIDKKMGIMMMDIDHFKSINDRYGHPIGDRVLIRLAEILRSTVGPYDFLGRHGGEEFVIIHFTQDEQEMLAFAEKIRNTIEQSLIRVDEHEIKFTVSIGLLYKTTLEGDYGKCISHADTLLYQAKEQGRNRIVSTTL